MSQVKSILNQLVKLIDYDSNTKTIFIPAKVNDSVTDKQIAYTFNGRYFEEKD